MFGLSYSFLGMDVHSRTKVERAEHWNPPSTAGRTLGRTLGVGRRVRDRARVRRPRPQARPSKAGSQRREARANAERTDKDGANARRSQKPERKRTERGKKGRREVLNGASWRRGPPVHGGRLNPCRRTCVGLVPQLRRLWRFHWGSGTFPGGCWRRSPQPSPEASRVPGDSRLGGHLKHRRCTRVSRRTRVWRVSEGKREGSRQARE